MSLWSIHNCIQNEHYISLYECFIFTYYNCIQLSYPFNTSLHLSALLQPEAELWSEQLVSVKPCGFMAIVVCKLTFCYTVLSVFSVEYLFFCPTLRATGGDNSACIQQTWPGSQCTFGSHRDLFGEALLSSLLLPGFAERQMLWGSFRGPLWFKHVSMYSQPAGGLDFWVAKWKSENTRFQEWAELGLPAKRDRVTE